MEKKAEATQVVASISIHAPYTHARFVRLMLALVDPACLGKTDDPVDFIIIAETIAEFSLN